MQCRNVAWKCGVWIRRFRERGMSLTELSEKTGITMANLSILKTGKARAVRFSSLDAICEALACQPGELLHYQEDV